MHLAKTTTPNERLTSLFLSENLKGLYLYKYFLTARLSFLSHLNRDMTISTCVGIALSAPVTFCNAAPTVPHSVKVLSHICLIVSCNPRPLLSPLAFNSSHHRLLDGQVKR